MKAAQRTSTTVFAWPVGSRGERKERDRDMSMARKRMVGLKRNEGASKMPGVWPAAVLLAAGCAGAQAQAVGELFVQGLRCLSGDGGGSGGEL